MKEDIEAYQFCNPFFLSDTFVYYYNESVGDTVWVKANGLGKIEETGRDIDSRVHFHVGDGKNVWGFKPATPANKSLIGVFSDEYWNTQTTKIEK